MLTLLLYIQVLLIGDASVGKTSLRSQFIHQIFSSAYRATIGCDFLTTKVTTDSDETVALQVWDTAGQERFNSIGLTFYRGTDVAILVYDITNATTFSHLNKWLKDFRDNSQVRHPAVVLVGNKLDKEDYRAVSTRQAHEFANTNWGSQSDDAVLHSGNPAIVAVEENCFEVSAKDNAAVNRIFKRVADIIVSQTAHPREVLDFDMDGHIDLELPTASPSSKCC